MSDPIEQACTAVATSPSNTKYACAVCQLLSSRLVTEDVDVVVLKDQVPAVRACLAAKRYQVRCLSAHFTHVLPSCITNLN